MWQQCYPEEVTKSSHQTNALGGAPRGQGKAGRPILGRSKGSLQVYWWEKWGNNFGKGKGRGGTGNIFNSSKTFWHLIVNVYRYFTSNLLTSLYS